MGNVYDLEQLHSEKIYMNGHNVDNVWVDEMVPELSGFDQRQARYREYNSKKKVRDLERRKQRQRKRNGFMR